MLTPYWYGCRIAAAAPFVHMRSRESRSEDRGTHTQGAPSGRQSSNGRSFKRLPSCIPSQPCGKCAAISATSVNRRPVRRSCRACPPARLPEPVATTRAALSPSSDRFGYRSGCRAPVWVGFAVRFAARASGMASSTMNLPGIMRSAGGRPGVAQPSWSSRRHPAHQ